MKLNLKKPLIIFDLETTGLDLVNDRIIQISYIKVLPNGEEERESIFVNPEKPIPHEVIELTGITNEDVANAPKFKEIEHIFKINLRIGTLRDSTPTTLTCHSWQKNS